MVSKMLEMRLETMLVSKLLAIAREIQERSCRKLERSMEKLLVERNRSFRSSGPAAAGFDGRLKHRLAAAPGPVHFSGAIAPFVQVEVLGGMMMLPILNYLRTTTSQSIGEVCCCVFVIACGVLAIIGTYSRGGFIGLVAIGVGYILFQRPKFGALLVPLALAGGVELRAGGLVSAHRRPSRHSRRMNLVNSRFAVWTPAGGWLFDRPLTGGGFSAIETDSVDFGTTSRIGAKTQTRARRCAPAPRTAFSSSSG